MADQDLPGQDSEITKLPADIRRDLAERAKGDLFFMASGVLGFRDLSIGCHGELCGFLDKNPARFKLVMMPRGHFKTSVATISRVLQKVCKNPNERILLANETSTNAQRFLNAIKQHAEGNKVFRALFSEIIPKNPKRWSAAELEFNRQWMGPEPTIDSCGMTGAMTSRHFTHITIDDPISEEAAKSDATMQDTITRIDKIISLMVKPDENSFDLIGTRWAYHDVYSHFMKLYGSKLVKFIRAAIEENDPIFPEFFSVESLAQARLNMGEYMFSCLYMNNPRDAAAQDFNTQDVRFWRWTQDENCVVLYDGNSEIEEVVELSKLDITVSVDLAVSEKITDDRNAVVTCGTTPSGKAIVLDVWAKRCTPLEVIERLFWLKQRFGPRAFGIEGVAYQKAFKYFLKAECERRGAYMNIVELKAIPSKKGTGNNSKEMRIRGLQPVAATHRLFVHPTQHILRNEMVDFPLGKNDDALDALAHQLTMWRGTLSPERMARYKKAEKQLLNSIDGYGLVRGYSHIGGGADYGKRPDVPHPDDLGIEPAQFEDWQDYVID
jgi:hypothetical protein